MKTQSRQKNMTARGKNVLLPIFMTAYLKYNDSYLKMNMEHDTPCQACVEASAQEVFFGSFVLSTMWK